jgi:hypothetical protein
MNSPSKLELAFDERMRQIYDQAKNECGYTATRFLQMVNVGGGLQAAKKLLGSGEYSQGLTRLWEEKRLDISLEATVLTEPWCELFTKQELSVAKMKLEALGWKSNG